MTKLKFAIGQPPSADIFIAGPVEQLDPTNSATYQKQEISTLEKLEFICILLNHLLIGFVTIYVTWTCMRVDEIPWHAVLCTIGLVFLMSEGLMAHYRGNACSRLCYRAERTRLHWIIQTSAMILGITGIIIKFALEPTHFYTLHGRLGLATFALLIISSLTGMNALYASYMSAYLRPIINKTLHNILGLLTYGLVMASTYTAFETNIFLEYSMDANNYTDFRILMKTATLTIFVFSSLGPLCALIYSKIWN